MGSAQSHELDRNKLIEQLHNLQKQNQAFIEFRKLQQINFKNLKEEFNNYDRKEKHLQNEIKRLRGLENDLFYSNERIKLKEDEIVKLLSDKDHFENELKNLDKDFNDDKLKYDDDLKKLSCDEDQIISLNNKFKAVLEVYNEKRDLLESEINNKQKLIEEENQRLFELNIELKRKLDEINDLNQQIVELKQELNKINDSIKQKEKQINNLKPNLKLSLKERVNYLEATLHQEYGRIDNEMKINIELNEECNNLKIKNNILKDELDKMNKELNDCLLHNQSLEMKINELRTKLENSVDEIDSLRVDAEKSEKLYNQEKMRTEMKIKSLLDEIEQLNLMYRQKLDKIVEVENERETDGGYENEIEDIRLKINDKFELIKATNFEQHKVDVQHEQAKQNYEAKCEEIFYDLDEPFNDDELMNENQSGSDDDDDDENLSEFCELELQKSLDKYENKLQNLTELLEQRENDLKLKDLQLKEIVMKHENIIFEYMTKLSETEVILNNKLIEFEAISNQNHQLNEKLQLKSYENDANVKKLNELAVENQRLLDQNKSIQFHCDDLHEKLVDFENELSLNTSLFEELSKTSDQKILEYDSKLAEIESALVNKEAELDEARQKINDTNEELRKKCLENEINLNKIGNLEVEKESEINKYKQKIDEMNTNMIATLSELDKNFESKLNEVETKHQNEAKNYQAKIANLENMLYENSIKLNEILSENEQLLSKMVNYEEDNSSVNELQALRDLLRQKDEIISKLEEKIIKLNDENLSSKKEIRLLSDEKDDNLSKCNKIIMKSNSEKNLDKLKFDIENSNEKSKCVNNYINNKFDKYIDKLSNHFQQSNIDLITQHVNEFHNDKEKTMIDFEKKTLKFKETVMEMSSLTDDSSDSSHQQDSKTGNNKRQVGTFEMDVDCDKQQMIITELKRQLKFKQQEIDLVKKENKLFVESKLELKRAHEYAIKNLNEQMQIMKKDNEHLKISYFELREHLQKFDEHYCRKKQKFYKNEATLIETLEQYKIKVKFYEINSKELNDKYLHIKQDYDKLNQYCESITSENFFLRVSIEKSKNECNF